MQGGARAIYVPFERKGQGKQFFFANEWLYPAITACKVDQCGDSPTHRPLFIEANVEKMETVTRKLQKTTDYAKLLEDKIQGRVQEAKAKAEAEEEAHGGKAQGGGKATKKTGADENAIRKQTTKELHDERDKQVARRACRFRDAAMREDTTTQWDLVPASVEEANIHYHEVIGRDAIKMRGRPKTTFKKTIRNFLEGMELEEDIAEKMHSISWLEKTA